MHSEVAARTEYDTLLEPIHSFLKVQTPQAWLERAAAPESRDLLLIDHLHCELKAAQSAALLLRRYVLDDEGSDQVLAWLRPYEFAVYRPLECQEVPPVSGAIPRIKLPTDSPWKERLQDRMLLLMKEELHHFVQVLDILKARGIALYPVSASRYAAGLIRNARTSEPGLLIDKLIIGALIEARSCERFAALAPYLDPELERFYVSLLRSEARHFEDYLKLAEMVAGRSVNEDIERLRTIEAELILGQDEHLRFHSGVPAY
ncbi:MAG: tRNA-(ms[2]io[6]A)-hydroxylase [Idiomarina sp.]|nr:tRNA-(ms[2]io[6]A)-hydroxylase [Idiomarina sp.]